MKPSRRLIPAVAALAVAVAALSGCVRVKEDVYVGADGVVTKASVQVSIPVDAAKQAGTIAKKNRQKVPVAVPKTLDEFKKAVFAEQPATFNADACTFTEEADAFLATCSSDTATSPAFLSTWSTGIASTVADGVVTTTVDVPVYDDTTEGVASPGAASVAGILTSPTTRETATLYGQKATLRVHMPAEVSTVTGTGAYVDSADASVVNIDLLAVVPGESITISTAAAAATAAPSAAPGATEQPAAEEAGGFRMPVGALFLAAAAAVGIAWFRRRRSGGSSKRTDRDDDQDGGEGYVPSFPGMGFQSASGQGGYDDWQSPAGYPGTGSSPDPWQSGASSPAPDYRTSPAFGQGFEAYPQDEYSTGQAPYTGFAGMPVEQSGFAGEPAQSDPWAATQSDPWSASQASAPTPVQQESQAQQPSAPPQFSPDGQWWWDGQQWLPADQAPRG